jgi:hypothetical protein
MRGRDVQEKAGAAILSFPAGLMVAEPAKQMCTQLRFINFVPPPSSTAPTFRK